MHPLFFHLCIFFKTKFDASACDDINPTRYLTNHNKEMKVMLPKHLKAAVQCKTQREFIEQSLADENLA